MTVSVGDLHLRLRDGPIAILRFGRLVRRRAKSARVIHWLRIFAGLFWRRKIESVRKVTQQTYRLPARPARTIFKADARAQISAWRSIRVTEGSAPLADILVQCPRTGAQIATGLKSEWVLLKSLPRVPIPVRCPACGQIHKWMPQDAWTGPVLPSPAPRLSSDSRAAS